MKIAILFILFLFLTSNLSAATIDYEADYLWVITSISIPQKDLKIYLLDTRQGICEPFGSYIAANDLAVKPYSLAAVRLSTGAVLKMFFFNNLTSLKQKIIDYCQTQNITFNWKPHTGRIKDWWLKRD